uniref:HHH_2 domain-containing protein n=1 Tax=Heterorhabditis bacteriophora TaxID=37862 RepID=A0A1I7X2T4_HETBA
MALATVARLDLAIRQLLPYAEPCLNIYIYYINAQRAISDMGWREANQISYHKLHPCYVHSRLTGKTENNYKCKVCLEFIIITVSYKNNIFLKILLALCNVEEPHHILRELNLVCYRMNWILVLCYSVRLLLAIVLCAYEKVKACFQVWAKKQDSIPVDERTALLNAAVGILTGARSVTKSDAQRLLFNFGSLKAISEASEEQLALCPGLGPVRAKNLWTYLRTPFCS